MTTMYKIGIIITAPVVSKRCLFKNRLLYRATFNWVARMGLKDSCAVVTDDESIIKYATDKGFKIIIKQDCKPKTHLESVLLGVNALSHLELDGYILAQVTSPLREDWLLDDVKASMQANPTKMTRVKSSIMSDTGALHGCPLSLVDMFKTGQCDLQTAEMCYVEQNAEASLDVDYPWHCFNAQNYKRLIYESANLKRPVHLPQEVCIVGSDKESLYELNKGSEIDSHDCVIRVNHLLCEYPEDVGNKLTYHFSKYWKLLEQSPFEKRVCSCFCKDTKPRLYDMCNFAVTPKVMQLFNGVSYSFISTGMKAIIWALHNGADVCHLYGFGDGTLRDKVSLYDGKVDDFAQVEWLECETQMLNKLQQEGLIILH